MCGIAGLFSQASSLEEDVEEVKSLVKNLRTRGPDADAVVRCDELAVMGGARLRITDAHNLLADLPMVSPSGRYTIVFNGEIYNHRELRKELAEYQFRTQSDTETILAAFECWREKTWEKLDGMFAIAIYDKRERALFCAVDPGGQKPLYYHHTQDAFVFASDALALIKDQRRQKTLCAEALAEVVVLRFIMGEKTHIKEIRKLPPGHALKVTLDSVTVNRYYLVPIGDQTNDDEERAAGLIRDAFDHSVRSLACYEGPIGVFLSGGLDSSAVLAQLRKYHGNIRTYSIGFEDCSGPSFEPGWLSDEFEYSDFLSKYFGTTHRKIVLTRKEFFVFFRRWAEIMGDPLCVNDPAPFLKLSEVASQDCRVVLSGSGSDEIFDGYGIPTTYGNYLETNARSFEEVMLCYLQRNSRAFGCDFHKLLPDQQVEARLISKMRRDLELYRDYVESPLQLGQLLMFHGRRAAYEFAMIDRATMAHSIEGRCPFGEKSLVKAAFDFAPLLKSKNGNEKYILKKALLHLLPESIIKRKKAPFPMPSGYFFTPEYEAMIQEALSTDSALSRANIIDLSYAESLLRSDQPESRPIFSRLVLLNLMLEYQAPYLTHWGT